MFENVDVNECYKGILDMLYDVIQELISEEYVIEGELIFSLPITHRAIKLDVDFRFSLPGIKFLHIKIPRLGVDITLTGLFKKLIFNMLPIHFRSLLDIWNDDIENSENWSYYVDGVYGVGTSFNPVKKSTWKDVISDFAILMLGILLFIALLKIGQKVIATRFWKKLTTSDHNSDVLNNTANVVSILANTNSLVNETGTQLSEQSSSISAVLKGVNAALKLGGAADVFSEITSDIDDVITAISTENNENETAISNLALQNLSDLNQIVSEIRKVAYKPYDPN